VPAEAFTFASTGARFGTADDGSASSPAAPACWAIPSTRSSPGSFFCWVAADSLARTWEEFSSCRSNCSETLTPGLAFSKPGIKVSCHSDCTLVSPLA
jgi:hypothetical protein